MTEEIKEEAKTTEHVNSKEENQAKNSKWRWVRRIGFGLLTVLLTLIIFLATGFGQRKTVGLVDKFMEQLSIGKVEGSLQNGLMLSDTKFVMDGVDVSVGQIDLHISFGCLLKREVCLENFAVKNTKVAVDTSKLPPATEDEEPKEPFTELNLPLTVSANNISLDNIDVAVNEMEINLEHFHTAITGKGRLVVLKPTELRGLNLLLAAPLTEEEQKALLEQNTDEISEQAVKKAAKRTGEKVVQQFEKLQGKEYLSDIEQNNQIDWVSIREQIEKPILDKNLRFSLPLDLVIEDIEIAKVNVSQKTKDEQGNFAEPFSFVNISSANIQAEAKDQKIELSTLKLDSDQGDLDAKGKLLLTEDYPLIWTLEANEAKEAKFKLPVTRVEATISGDLYNKTLLNIDTSGAIKANLVADVALATEKNPLNLNLTSKSITYPFEPKKGEDVFKLENIAINLTGDPTDYRLNTSANAKGMEIPASSVNLQGRGELTNFVIEDLTLNALEGKTQLAGRVDWTEGVEWDAKTTLTGINTKSLVPDWAAILSGGLQSKGYAGRGNNAADWQAEVSNIDLKGNLLQKKLQLQGSLKATPTQLLDVPALNLVYGENNIALKGILGDKSDFIADIKAPDLQGLVPSLRAGINGLVKLSGKMTEPNLDLDLTASNVAYDDLKLQYLTAKGKVSTEKTVQGDISLGIKQFSMGDIKVENADVIVSGNETNHSLKFTSKGNPVGANLNIAGKFDRNAEVWSGQISDIVINSTDFGSFKTDKALNVNYNNKQVNANISAHCWNNPQINLCFPQAFNAGQEGKVPFEIRNFDLKFVQEFLDKNSRISGIVNAKGDAAWFKNKQPQVNAELNSNSLKFIQKLDGGDSFPLTITPLKITANMADNNLNLKTDVKIENNGRLTSDLVMKDLTNTRSLSGSINIDKLTLKLIKPLLTAGENVDGEINARLNIAGSATSPLLNGKLDLTHLKARANAMPFTITGGGLNINFNGATSTLTGRVQTPESELRLEGNADWRNLEAWKTRVHAQANRFKVNVPNLAKVEISPDIEVTATPTSLILGGNIDIPWARIEVQELPETAIGVSSDEIIMDGSAKNKVPLAQRQIPVQASSGMAIKSDIKINIGDDVKLKAYGLDANLKGSIAVRQGKQGLGLYGQVNIYRGRFASFGQDLLIRKGTISFAGLPSQPMLDIEAIRNPEAMEDSTITAGVRVTGLADSPEVKIFSDPSMSQNEAMSYLLTGRSLENSGDAGSSNSMAAALLSMSLSKSSKAVGDVGSAFGLKDLSVSTAGIGDNTKVEVSASLAPKFRVKYGVGIFAPLTELTLRYNLTQKLYLQWVSSINQAVDLMYRFEFD